MAVYRKVPASIMTVDYLGITSSQSETYRKRAEAELSKLEGMVLRGDLEQGFRRFNLGDNVEVECTVCYNLKQAVVIIGANIETGVVEKSCYCCSPCLVAGVINKIKDIEPEEPTLYEKEADYFADILICQAPDSATPRQITMFEERASSGKTVMNSRVIQNMSYGAEMMYDAIFSDYQHHQPGDVVLVLVQPLYDFIPSPFGVYSPCINKRQVADESFLYPRMTCTADFVNSSGMSCQIAKDKQVWTDDEDLEMYGDPKKYPFRILPIKIKSCL